MPLRWMLQKVNGRRKLVSERFSTLDSVVSSIHLHKTAEVELTYNYSGGALDSSKHRQILSPDGLRFFLRERFGSMATCRFESARQEIYGKNGTQYHFLDIVGRDGEGRHKLKVHVSYSTS